MLSHGLIKLALSILGASLIACICTACGIATGNGFVIGTTGYLREANRAELLKIKRQDNRTVGAVF